MTAFGAYSAYYDLVYAAKDYAKEAAYVTSVVKRHRPMARTVLDLGCGTGVHACAFARAGYHVTGIDRSETMLEKARERAKKERAAGTEGSVEFILGDIREFALSGRFDVVTALFHVISYLPRNDDLHAVFANVRQHIDSSGVFIFDHWYGPGVLSDPPTQRVKVFEDEAIKVIRIATPDLRVNDNLVDVHYQLLVIDKASGRCEQLSEDHRMRYLFRPELEDLLVREGFRIIAFNEWLSENAPQVTSWNTVVTAIPSS